MHADRKMTIRPLAALLALVLVASVSTTALALINPFFTPNELYTQSKTILVVRMGKPVDKKLILVKSTHIVARESTDVMTIPDEEVAEALKFIRLHAKSNIQVEDVVQHAGISRRGLYNKFRKTLGRSVFDEIMRIRTEQIKKLLLETNFNISQIAQIMNFSGPEKLDRYFRRLNNMTPLSYRKKHKIH